MKSSSRWHPDLVGLQGSVGHALSWRKAGNRSLVSVLTSDGNRFDRNGGDHDVVTEAALAVIKAKPEQPGQRATKGRVPVTSFIPNDWPFRKLAKDLTGTRYSR